jgi:hypothetical protein
MQLLDLDAIEAVASVRRRNRRPRQIWLVDWSPAGTLYGAYFVASDSERVTGIEPAPSVWKSDPGLFAGLVIMEKCLQAPVLLACTALARDG